MNTSPELMMHIRNVICAQMPYGGSIVSHDALTNDDVRRCHIYEMGEKITRSHRIGSERSQSISGKVFKMWKLYPKNVMFACSLPMSTSTWCSDHCNGPGAYMSGEFKSENINTKKAPTRQSHHPEKITQPSHRIQLHLR
jgi:hypothetical protein